MKTDRNKMIVTIDGPAGAGKTTVAKALALKLGCRYLDTGALYRTVAFFVDQAGIDPVDSGRIMQICNTLTFQWRGAGQQGGALICNGQTLNPAIRQPNISMLASQLSALPDVRAALLAVQHQLAEKGAIVCEGRDMGTVVFPHATLKFFLDADLAVRAKRRFDQSAQAAGQTLSQVCNELRCRDDQDRQRKAAPLAIADDAIVIDSSQLASDQVVQTLYDHILQQRGD